MFGTFSHSWGATKKHDFEKLEDENVIFKKINSVKIFYINIIKSKKKILSKNYVA